MNLFTEFIDHAVAIALDGVLVSFNFSSDDVLAGEFQAHGSGDGILSPLCN